MRNLFGMILVALLLSLASCNLGPRVQGSGVSKTETRQAAGFTKVHIEGAADATIDVDPTQPASVSITCDDNILPIVETVVKGDTLYIKTKQNYSSTLGVKAAIRMPACDGAAVSGSGNIVARKVASKSFDVGIAGSGDVKLDGVSDALSVSIAGSGDVDSYQLTAQVVEVSVSGSGGVKVNANNKLTVSISGAGDVVYTGTPAVTKQISGSGSVHPR